MDNNKFNEESKEQLEKEIQELKRQKEIRDLQRQKEELERTMFGSVGGSTAEKQEKVKEKIEEDSKEEVNFFSNRKTTILAGVVALFIVAIGSGIFYLNAQNKRKKDNLKKLSVPAIVQSQNMASITTPQPQPQSQTVTNGGSGKEAAESILKETVDILQKGEYSSTVTDKNALESMNLFKEAYKKISYKVNNTTETQDKVVLNVTMRYPDLSGVSTLLNQKVTDNVQQLQGKSETAIQEQTMKWMKELINQKINDPSVKYLEETFDITYKNVNGNWTAPDEMDPKFNKVMTFNMGM
ncbi:hypothetical protein [Leptotrichia trevisanii]|jgi:hypothetical protein|uniref:Uncharacterized protein n=1 Tax=Leptotrichia trevisanii TaxID=109328 RepID=A0A510K091_9FUSO|nr:hypothetical protein [Leptotrichia trevisanii]BBM45059.1 hypothetical protein JMUB3870_1177 [Leptotrichia trevisanii]